MFYKDNEKQHHISSSRFGKAEDNQATGVVPPSIQKILDEKKEQLDKAMKFYNQEQSKLNSTKLLLE